jgi:hypothetical protein
MNRKKTKPVGEDMRNESINQLSSVLASSNFEFLREVAEFGNENNVMIYEIALEEKNNTEIDYCETRKNFLKHLFSILDYGLNEYSFEKGSPLVFKKQLVGELRDFEEMMQDHDVQEGGVYDSKDFKKMNSILETLE